MDNSTVKCTNYAMVVLPSRMLGDAILYFRHYKAEIGGEDSRTCRCFWDTADPRLFYIGCQEPNRCKCTPCCKHPLSLKNSGVQNCLGFLTYINTTYDQYVYAVQFAVNIPPHQLVPFFEFPGKLTEWK
jgi:hypothetical protein